MNRTVVTLAAVAALLAACASDPDSPDAAPTPADGAEASSVCDPALDEAFGAWAEAGFSGTVAVTTAGEPDCLAGYGLADEATETPNTADTVYSIGSITKAFTAAAVLDLVDTGRLALDDRAGDHVPGLTGPAADATLEHLLVHTSGLTGAHGQDYVPLDHDAAVAALGRLELAFEPGTDYGYSNAGYTLLALVVELASGTSYRDHAAERILPLPDGGTAGGFWSGEPAAEGPRAVGYLDDGSPGQSGDFAGPHWALDGNGGLAMTTGELATWTHALFTGQVVSPEATEVLATPGFDHGDGSAETPGWVAYDASRFGEPVIASAGGGGDVGHNVVLAWLPESERVLAMASNRPEILAEDLLAAIGPALVAGDPLPTPEAPAGDVDPEDLAAAARTYELEAGGGSFEVTARDDGLEAAATGLGAVTALFPLPAGLPADEAAAHGDRLLALLAGETQEGRDEQAAFAADFGPIDHVELGGTVADGGELRTYATVTSGTESILVWYALDEQGAVSAAEVPTDPPSLVLLPAAGGGFRPDDPLGTGPDVTVTFDGDAMTITGPAGSTTARSTA